VTALAQSPHTCEVVACVVSDGNRTCLVRRSQQVASDRGRWHCVTGYLDPGLSPRACVLRELEEELSLGPVEIGQLDEGPELVYADGAVIWVVHTFLAATARRHFDLNWENEAYKWTDDPRKTSGCVWWLGDVYDALAFRPLTRGRIRTKSTGPASVHRCR
jgi:ADP-ribose pyrophosphatase YjhB (NUDIX family)